MPNLVEWRIEQTTDVNQFNWLKQLELENQAVILI